MMKSVRGGKTGNSGLSERFWHLADGLLGAWDIMNDLLEQEWDMLKTRRMGGLVRIVREKEGLASKLEALERLLDQEISGLSLPAADPDARWQALCRASGSVDETARLVQWKSSLAGRKQMAFETNRRLWVWAAQQHELTQRLTCILAGRSEEEPPTYHDSVRARGADSGMGPLAKKGAAGMGMTHDGAVSGTGERVGSGSAITGMSPGHVSSALRAYGVTGGVEERLRSWD